MSLHSTGLGALIAAAKAGSKEATGELLERYRPYLRYQARQNLDPALIISVDESDLVQDVDRGLGWSKVRVLT